MSDKYFIGYLDDDEYCQIRFQNLNEDEEDFEITDLPLLNSVEELIEKIQESSIDAVVFDYRLNERLPEIHFNGIQVLQALEQTRTDFPTFVLTSYDEDAEDQDVDVNKIYLKEKYYNDDTSRSFQTKVA